MVKKKVAKKKAAGKSVAKKPVAKKSQPKKSAAKSKKLLGSAKKVVGKKKASVKPVAKVKKTPNAKQKVVKAPEAKLVVQTLTSLRVAALVSKSSPVDFPGTWRAFGPLIKERKLDGGATLAAFTVKNGHISWYAACIVADPSAAVAPPMQSASVGGGRYLVFSYVGGYDGMGNAWAALMKRVKAEGHEIDSSRHCLEVYKDDGSKSADRKPTTDLCVPV